ncbi:class I SAM-dependent methyltransferase [Comamonas composti]|uniref:class I SAM-dependent methyltransferase n=1 Tax=Comamonas composti TaxID=408558 RepID=UPI000425B361|nr:methyltransferase type 12 [Comamonas composti]
MKLGTLFFWPLPALLVWLCAWSLYLLPGLWLPEWVGLLAGGLLGSLAAGLGHNWWRRLLIASGFPLSWIVLWAGSLPTWSWLLLLGLLALVYPLNAWRDAPLYPTPQNALEGLAQIAPLPEGAAVLDAGCGLGHGLQALRAQYPQARLHGLEWSWPLRWMCAVRCPWAQVRRADIWLADWSGYAMVYLFQRPESMGRAAVKAVTELAPGAWVVSLDFQLPGLEPHWHRPGPGRHGLWVYRLPPKDCSA